MTIANSGWSGETGQGASSGPGAICRHKPFHNRKAWLATMAFHIFFLMLIVVNVVRTLRHPMWRDEMGTFQIATASASLWELLSKLQYTTHPGLWYSLVWLATRFTSDPTSMAIMHIVCRVDGDFQVVAIRNSRKVPIAAQLFPVLGIFCHQPQLCSARTDRLCLCRPPAAPSTAECHPLAAAGFACEHACAGRHLVDRAGEHIGHKAGAPDTALRNWRGDLPRPPGVLGQDSSAGAGFWTMGYGCSVR